MASLKGRPPETPSDRGLCTGIPVSIATSRPTARPEGDYARLRVRAFGTPTAP